MITDDIMDHSLCFSKQQLVKNSERWQHNLPMQVYLQFSRLTIAL